nr:hypothetical protein [Tanacetum cinerariifolium]
MTEPNLEKYSELAQTELNLYITNNDINIELSKKFLEELQMNKYHGWIDEDVINHIAIVLKMIDSIYIPSVDSHQLRMKIFLLTLEEEMLDEGDNLGIDPLEFISRIIHHLIDMKMDGRTKRVLFHAWMNGSWNKRQMDDKISSNNNTTVDAFFKPYLINHGKSNTEMEDEQSQTKRKYCNTSESIDEQPSKIMCKT